MPELKYSGFAAFARGIANIVKAVRDTGKYLAPGGIAEKNALKEYEAVLKKNIDDNLSGKTIPKSAKKLNDPELRRHVHIGRGGKGRGVPSISVRIKSGPRGVNMIGRGLALDEGGLVKPQKGRFLTIPLGAAGGKHIGTVRDFAPKTTFQIFADPKLRRQRVSKGRNRMQPRYLMVRGPGRKMTPVFKYVRSVKITPRRWLEDATERAFAHKFFLKSNQGKSTFPGLIRKGR